MASLRKRRGNWYGRIRGAKHGKRFETNIPLNTQSKVTAMERFMEVRKVERHIKEGMNFTFPWLSNVNQTELICLKKNFYFLRLFQNKLDHKNNLKLISPHLH